MRFKQHSHYWLGIALAACLYALLYCFKLSILRESLNIIANLSAVWLVTLAFLYIYLHWNGPRSLRNFGDEIRVLPRYRAFLATLCYEEDHFKRLVYFHFFSILCVALVRPKCLFPYMIWGSAAYYGLIATDILAHLELISRRRAIWFRIGWAGISIWVPVCATVTHRVSNIHASGDSIFSLVLDIYYFVSMVMIFFLPLRVSTQLYLRARKELSVLKSWWLYEVDPQL